MKFEDALKCMREGKKVTRKTYTCYFFMESNVIFVIYLYKTDKKTINIKEQFWLGEILAEDWEIVDE